MSNPRTKNVDVTWAFLIAAVACLLLSLVAVMVEGGLLGGRLYYAFWLEGIAGFFTIVFAGRVISERNK